MLGLPTLRNAFVKAAFWIPLGLCTVVAFTANPTGIAAELSGILAHAGAFTYLAVALCVAHYRSGPLAAVALWMLAFGVAIEVGQTFIPGRGGELLDVAIDGAGILVGCVLYRLWLADTAALQVLVGDRALRGGGD